MSNIGNLGHFKMKGNTIDIVDTDARNKNEEQEARLNNLDTSMGEQYFHFTDLNDKASKRIDNVESELNNVDKTLAGHTSELSLISQNIKDNATAISTETNARTSADNAINQKVEQKADKADTVTGVTITNENGVYTLSETKNGTTTEIGTIETSKSNNPVIEVKDTVTEELADNYEHHEFAETTEDGTENNVGQFYLANKQIIELSTSDSAIVVKTVDQAGNVNTEDVQLPDSVTNVTITEDDESYKISQTLLNGTTSVVGTIGKTSGSHEATNLLTVSIPHNTLGLSAHTWPQKNEVGTYLPYVINVPALVKRFKKTSHLYACNPRYINPSDQTAYDNACNYAFAISVINYSDTTATLAIAVIGIGANENVPDGAQLAIDIYAE